MFCIECGQKLPDNAKFCSRCGTAVNNISNTTPPPIMDDVAAKVEDVVITDEMPSLDAQGVNDDVLRKASFMGYADESTPPTKHHIPINEPQLPWIETPYPKVSKTTFFGGELTLVKTEHSKDDFSFHFQGKNFIGPNYANINQTSNQSLFIATLISNGKKILLRWDSCDHTIKQDITDSFDNIVRFVGNYIKVENNSKCGVIRVTSNNNILDYVLECRYPNVSFKIYYNYQLVVLNVNNSYNNYFYVICTESQPCEKYICFQEIISQKLFKVQKSDEPYCMLLRWDASQNVLANALQSHQFQYISDSCTLDYLKVKENGKYGFAKVNPEGVCELTIPCIFDEVGEWSKNYQGMLDMIVEELPRIISPVKYKGKPYIIDDKMRFYEAAKVPRFGRAISSIIGWVVISIILSIVSVVIWGLLIKGCILGYINDWIDVMGNIMMLLFVINILILAIAYYSKTKTPYIRVDIQNGEYLVPKRINYAKLKVWGIIYFLISLVPIGIFAYELYLFKYKFDEIYAYNNLNVAVYPAKENNKWGYVDLLGREVFPFQYDAATAFDSRFARVILDGKFGVINLYGETTIPPTKYDYIGHSENGFARDNVGGEFLVDDDFWWWSGSDNVKGGRWGYINMSGEEIISPQYDYILESDPDLLVVNIGGIWDVKKEGNNEVHGIHGGKWGIIDRKGNEITPVIWDKIVGPDAKAGTYRLSYKNQSITINKKGERVE